MRIPVRRRKKILMRIRITYLASRVLYFMSRSSQNKMSQSLQNNSTKITRERPTQAKSASRITQTIKWTTKSLNYQKIKIESQSQRAQFKWIHMQMEKLKHRGVYLLQEFRAFHIWERLNSSSIAHRFPQLWSVPMATGILMEDHCLYLKESKLLKVSTQERRSFSPMPRVN